MKVKSKRKMAGILAAVLIALVLLAFDCINGDPSASAGPCTGPYSLRKNFTRTRLLRRKARVRCGDSAIQ